MQIILVEPEEKLRGLFILNLKNDLGAEVLCRDDVSEAISFAHVLGDLDYIIIKDRISENETADALIKRIVSDDLKNIKVIVIGRDVSEKHDFVEVVDEAISPKDLSKLLSEQSKPKEANISTNQKISIPLENFHFVKSLPCDVYIKKGDNFLKIFQADEETDLNKILEYKNKGLEELFIDEEHFCEFVSIVNNIFAEAINNPELDKKTKGEIHKVVVSQMRELGVNEASMNMAEKVVDDLVATISVDKSMQLINDIYKSATSYRYQRCYMVCILSNLILKELSWGEKKLFESICFAAFVSETFLHSSDEIRICDDEEIRSLTKNKDERSRIQNHARLAAENLSKDSKISDDVVTIVKQHHGSVSGVGYPTEIKGLSKLSYIYFVCDEFVRRVLSSPRKNINVVGLTKEINTKFHENQDITKVTNLLLSVFSGKS